MAVCQNEVARLDEWTKPIRDVIERGYPFADPPIPLLRSQLSDALDKYVAGTRNYLPRLVYHEASDLEPVWTRAADLSTRFKEKMTLAQFEQAWSDLSSYLPILEDPSLKCAEIQNTVAKNPQ